MRRFAYLPSQRPCWLWVLLLVASVVCVFGVTGRAPATAGEYDWAVPSGPLPQVPEPNPPSSDDSGSYDSGDSSDDSGDSDPLPEPTYIPTPSQNQNTATPPPAADPQQQFESQKEVLLKEFHMPDALTDDAPGSDTTASVDASEPDFGAGPVPRGLSDAEWAEAAACEAALDTLYAKWPLSASDEAERARLEARRTELWQKAISMPGLTTEERDRLRLKIRTLPLPSGAVTPTVGKETIDKWLKPPPLLPDDQGKPAVATVNPVSSWLVGQFALGQMQSGIEAGGEAWADAILDEHNYGDFLGVSKIAVAYKEGGVASALAEAGNYLVGKIPIPQASMAVEGGRQYANVAFQAQNKFMTDAMKAAGGEFDKEKFWSDFNEDLSAGQKAVKEWIGYGTN